MKVFKFGGASVSSADAVRGMARIVQSHIGTEPLVVVVSAMGKTTNLLERLVPGVSSKEEAAAERVRLEEYHKQIAHDLLPDDDRLIDTLDTYLELIDALRLSLRLSDKQYAYNYDQVVSFGERLSTAIISSYLNAQGVRTMRVDATHLVRTDQHYREGRVDWETTERNVQKAYAMARGHHVLLTQGFLGGTGERVDLGGILIDCATTLGREGSDYSAAILAHCLKAESVTIWKDVPGFLNADPKYFRDTVKIDHLPYNEAIEQAYYGASVIHPKTVKPLQNRNIPLYIRSFVDPEAEGSAIGNYASIQPTTPLYIFRPNQILLSIAPHDYSFIAEDNLQTIFGVLNEVGVRVNLMQNSALSFSLCIDDNPQLTPRLIERLGNLFRVRYNQHLQLITIRYYTPQVVENIVGGRPILLEQRSRTTAQLIVGE